MKKKKDNSEIIVISGIILVVSLILLFYFYSLPKLRESHFEIYEEECKSVTQISNMREIWDAESIINNIEYYFYNFGCDYLKEINLSLHSLLSTQNSICVEYENLIKELMDAMPLPIEITEEICEFAEVDEILDEEYHYWFTPKNRTLKITDDEKKQCETENLKEMYGFQGVWIDKGDYFACLKKISKQDLTIEWLDENCEREWKEDDVKCWNKKYGSSPCGRLPTWICGENYYVEVER